MKILVIGSGAREHALVWKISQSKLAEKVFCAPGNAGISRQAECVDLKAEDLAGLLEFAKREKIGLTVVGPEAALAAGIVDQFEKSGLIIFGPNQKAAQLEASKVFAKELMAKYDLPSAGFKIFTQPEEAEKYIETIGDGCVVKADGLAQGKGVVVAKTVEEAKRAICSMMRERIFGDAGKRIIIEERLEGQEASILALTDSKTIIPLASSQDHKRVFDRDQGPNTGGMGAYSPASIVSPELLEEILEKVFKRIINGLTKEKIIYKGILYAGIIITKDGPKVLEFNVRFGDPETQAILPRLESDLLLAMLAVCKNELSLLEKLKWDKRSCVSLVCASKGYPGDYEKGKEIFGLDQLEKLKDVVVFHSGTKLAPIYSGRPAVYLTNGGRVLSVTALGDDIKEAIARAYQAAEKIHFEGMHYRRDIGQKAVI